MHYQTDTQPALEEFNGMPSTMSLLRAQFARSNFTSLY